MFMMAFLSTLSDDTVFSRSLFAAAENTGVFYQVVEAFSNFSFAMLLSLEMSYISAMM